MKHLDLYLIELAYNGFPMCNYIKMYKSSAHSSISLDQLGIKEGHNGGWFKVYSARIAVF